jgi:hypothetical protein
VIGGEHRRVAVSVRVHVAAVESTVERVAGGGSEVGEAVLAVDVVGPVEAVALEESVLGRVLVGCQECRVVGGLRHAPHPIDHPTSTRSRRSDHGDPVAPLVTGGGVGQGRDANGRIQDEDPAVSDGVRGGRNTLRMGKFPRTNG